MSCHADYLHFQGLRSDSSLPEIFHTWIALRVINDLTVGKKNCAINNSLVVFTICSGSLFKCPIVFFSLWMNLLPFICPAVGRFYLSCPSAVKPKYCAALISNYVEALKVSDKERHCEKLTWQLACECLVIRITTIRFGTFP